MFQRIKHEFHHKPDPELTPMIVEDAKPVITPEPKSVSKLAMRRAQNFRIQLKVVTKTAPKDFKVQDDLEEEKKLDLDG